MDIFQKGTCAGTMIRQMQSGGLHASISRYASDRFNHAWHYHSDCRLSFILHGGCAERKRGRYERMPGSVTVYRPGEPHRVEQMRDAVQVNLEIQNDFLERYSLSATLDWSMDRTADVQFLFLQLYKELIAQDSLTASSLDMLLLGFLQPPARVKKTASRPPWVGLVQQLMQDRWNESLSLRILSEETGIHPVTISSYFPRYFACTFGEYQRKLKVSHALQLVRATDQSLTSIAYECGFSDQSHFIHTFKNLTGFLPGEYRKLVG